MNNILFALEGPDGCGKTQMSKDLQKEIMQKHPEVEVKIFPLPFPFSFGYEKLREMLKTPFDYPPDIMQSLFVLNMIDCAENSINPYFIGKKENRIGILDRSLISTIIYNSLNQGHLFKDMVEYSYTIANEMVPGSIAPHEVDLDIINKVYGHLIQPIEATFFLFPPDEFLEDNARARNSEEVNDQIEVVLQIRDFYESFYDFLIDSKRIRIPIRYIENSSNMLFASKSKRSKYIRQHWDYYENDIAKNYEAFRKKILTKLNL